MLTRAYLLLALVAAGSFIACGPGASRIPGWSSNDRETQIKLSVSPENAYRLNVRSQVSLTTAGLRLPVAIASGGDGVFVCDNNAAQMYRVDPASGTVSLLTLNPGKSDGIRWPNATRWRDGQLFFTDAAGIRSFRGLDQTALINTFFTVEDFVLDRKDALLVVPSLRQTRGSDPLVLELSASGEKKSEFGTSSGEGYLNHLRNSGHIAADDRNVLLAFAHQPRVAIFDRATHERRDLAIQHPAFSGLERLDRDATFNHPRANTFRLSQYLSGILLDHGQVLTMLAMPYVDIRQYDLDGTPRKSYIWMPPSQITRFFGIDRDPRNPHGVLVGYTDLAGDDYLVSLDGVR